MVYGAALEKRSPCLAERGFESHPLRQKGGKLIMVEKTYKSDSYKVDIIRPSTTFPIIRIIKRKKKREPNAIAEDYQIGPPLGNVNTYNDNNIDEIARQIGRAILDDSQIIFNWKASHP